MPKTHLKAQEAWDKITTDIQQKLLDNVFCVNCGVTTIVDYTLKLPKHGLTLEGKCKKCSGDVARVIESS